MSARPPRPFLLQGNSLEPVPVDPASPPTLFVVVDTEAEFDWNQAFTRSAVGVNAMAEQHLAQAILDGFAIRPIYVVDYAVATDPDGYGPLRAILDRHGCAIGAHLHPWINPPFEETLSNRNSFAGNLPPALETRKLRALVEAIRTGFDIDPLFFKAGRYGLGPHTLETLAELGFAVDFSILPGMDLRATGGPDFRAATTVPYRAANGRILSLPMTRGQIGLLPPMSVPASGILQSRAMLRLRLPGLLARLQLANAVTLTPEGVLASEQIALLDALVRRGVRTFVLHYHSSSLGGFTPYVRGKTDLAEFLRRLEQVCRHFVSRLGGVPGDPADLLPTDKRSMLYPAAAPKIDAKTA